MTIFTRNSAHFVDFNFLTDYSADKAEIIARVLCIGKDHPTLEFAFDEVKSSITC